MSTRSGDMMVTGRREAGRLQTLYVVNDMLKQVVAGGLDINTVLPRVLRVALDELGADDAVLPHPPFAHAGYRLIQEQRIYDGTGFGHERTCLTLGNGSQACLLQPRAAARPNQATRHDRAFGAIAVDPRPLRR